jgi:hypothetical protein
MQSKKAAWLEQFVRVGIGFVTNYPINIAILSAFGLQTSGKGSMGEVGLYITVVFTIWSLIRGYVVRRVFAYFEVKNKSKTVQKVAGFESNSDCLNGQIGFVTCQKK